MTAEIADITPAYEPIGVARGMLERAPNCTAGVAVLVMPDGKLWYDMCGSNRADIMWALQRMVYSLMEDEQ